MDDRRTDGVGGGVNAAAKTWHSGALLLTLCTAIVVLLLGIVAARFYVGSRQPIQKATLLEFADFEYTRELTKADVTRMLGPATSSDPRKPGFAECCHWEVDYPALVGSDSYRLTLSFNTTGEQEVVAGGLYKNGNVVRAE